MQRKMVATIALLMGMSLVTTPRASESMTAAQSVPSIPLTFTENSGQWDSQVLFRTKAGGATLWFAADGVYHQFLRKSGASVEAASGAQSHQHQLDNEEPSRFETMSIKAAFVDCRADVTACGDDLMQYRCNYFLGDDQSKWRTEVSNYRAIVYEDIYDGIDLKYYANGQQLEYDFIVQPGADISQILIEYDGVESLAVNDAGELVVRTRWGEFKELAPKVYQVVLGQQRSVNCQYVLLSDKSFGFILLSSYDPTLVVVIDPTLAYSTFLGGSDYDQANDVAVDAYGCAYVVGWTSSSDFGVHNAFDSVLSGGQDVFITKLTSAGNDVVYSTFLGGSDDDYGYSIAVDKLKCAYVTGSTGSSDFPTENACEDTYNEGGDAFVTKLSEDGNALVYSTYLGGGNSETGAGIAVDGSHQAIVVGTTTSPDFDTHNEFDATLGGSRDAFVTIYSAAGNTYVFSSFLGGSDSDLGKGVAVDGSGNVYVTGHTISADFLTVNAYDDELDELYDSFVTKIPTGGGYPDYSTYVGGSTDDLAWDIAVTSDGAAHVICDTRSSELPTPGAYDASFNGGQYDAYLFELSPDGSQLTYGTFLGGTGAEYSTSIAIDGSGNVVVTGGTRSPDFPVKNAIDDSYSNGEDVFVTWFPPDGDTIVFSTYLGESSTDRGRSIAIGGVGRIFVAGYTYSSDFPTTPDSYDPTFNGGSADAFALAIQGDPFTPTKLLPSQSKLKIIIIPVPPALKRFIGSPDETALLDLFALSELGGVEKFAGLVSGGFDSLGSIVVTTDSGLVDMTTDDMNEDGYPDLLLANKATNTVCLHSGLGGNTFSSSPDNTVSLSGSPIDLKTEDFDRDGNRDLLVATHSPNEIVLVYGRGNGTFDATHTTISLSSVPNAIVTADFNVDGFPDVAIALSPGTIEIHDGDGNGSIDPSPSYTHVPAQDSHKLVVGDWDRDGDTDLGIIFAAGTEDFQVLRNEMFIWTDISYPTGFQGHSSVSSADFSGDGWADILITSEGRDSVAYLQSDQAGGFEAPYLFGVGDGPVGIAVADYSYDGFADIVVLCEEAQEAWCMTGNTQAVAGDDLTITSPSGGEAWDVGTEQTITWTKSDGIYSVDVQVSRDSGSSWHTLASGQSGTSFAWFVTAPATSEGYIRVFDPSVASRSDVSDTPFSITGTCCTIVGDVDHNGDGPDIADLIYLVSYMFQGGPEPACDEPYSPDCPEHYYPELDVDGNETCDVDIADLIYLVSYMFQGGPLPVPCS